MATLGRAAPTSWWSRRSATPGRPAASPRGRDRTRADRVDWTADRRPLLVYSGLLVGDRFFATQAEQRLQVLGAHFGDPGLAGADDGFGKLDFAFDKLVERFFEGTGADVLVHLDVARLADSE